MLSQLALTVSALELIPLRSPDPAAILDGTRAKSVAIRPLFVSLLNCDFEKRPRGDYLLSLVFLPSLVFFFLFPSKKKKREGES
jgi:hypothetical protein